MFPFGRGARTPTQETEDALLSHWDLDLLDQGLGGDAKCVWKDFPRSGGPLEQDSGGAGAEGCAWPPAGASCFPAPQEASRRGVWTPCGELRGDSGGEQQPGGSQAGGDGPGGGRPPQGVEGQVALDVEELERLQDLAGRTPLPGWIQVSARGKPRTYEWPPQSEPEMERKRQRALRAFGSRQKASQREFQLQSQRRDLARLILDLLSQNQSLRRRIALREAQLRELQRQDCSGNG